MCNHDGNYTERTTDNGIQLFYNNVSRFYEEVCYLDYKRCAFERNIQGNPVHCRTTEHLQYCADHQCPDMFKCKASYCIAIHMVCDGVNDCPENEDERYAPGVMTE